MVVCVTADAAASNTRRAVAVGVESEALVAEAAGHGTIDGDTRLSSIGTSVAAANKRRNRVAHAIRDVKVVANLTTRAHVGIS